MPAGPEILTDVAKGKLQPIYYLCGEERFLVERTVAALRRAAVGEDSGLNYELLIGREVGVPAIVAAARTLPMLGKRRLVLVREADGLPAADLGDLKGYIEDPNPSTCLVFVAQKADTRQSFFKGLDKKGFLVRMDPLPLREVPRWLRAEAKLQGAAIDSEASELLIDHVGGSLGPLSAALERLMLYVGRGGEIDAAVVEEVVVQVRVRSVFELCDYCGRGNLQGALEVLDRMIRARERPTGIAAMLARHIRQLWGIRELRAQRMRDAEISGQLGIRPFLMRSLGEQAGRFGRVGFRRAHRAIAQADRALKGSKIPGRTVLERCVLELVASAGRQG